MHILSDAARRRIDYESSIKLIEDRIRFAPNAVETEPNEQDMGVVRYGPEFGWIDLKLSSAGQNTLHIEFSDVYNPFPWLRIFLEQNKRRQKTGKRIRQKRRRAIT